MEGLANFLVGGKVHFAVVFPVSENDSVEQIQENAIDALRDYLDDNHTVSYAFRSKKVEQDDDKGKEEETTRDPRVREDQE